MYTQWLSPRLNTEHFLTVDRIGKKIKVIYEGTRRSKNTKRVRKQL